MSFIHENDLGIFVHKTLIECFLLGYHSNVSKKRKRKTTSINGARSAEKYVFKFILNLTRVFTCEELPTPNSNDTPFSYSSRPIVRFHLAMRCIYQVDETDDIFQKDLGPFYHIAFYPSKTAGWLPKAYILFNKFSPENAFLQFSNESCSGIFDNF